MADLPHVRGRVVVALIAGVLGLSLFAGPASAKPVKPASGPTALTEDFTDPSGWVIVEQGPSGARAENGEVTVEIREPKNGHRVFSPQGTPLPTSYAVEVDAARQAGDPDTADWGVSCHATLNQSYEFSISTDGFFAIYRSDASSSKRIDREKDKAARRRGKKAIKRGADATNRIRGECFADGTLRLFVNGKFVEQAVDPTPLSAGDFVGFQAEASALGDGPLDVAFDNVELFDLT